MVWAPDAIWDADAGNTTLQPFGNHQLILLDPGKYLVHWSSKFVSIQTKKVTYMVIWY
jgi:hypothetical protein